MTQALNSASIRSVLARAPQLAGNALICAGPSCRVCTPIASRLARGHHTGKHSNRIETMYRRLKDWRRFASYHDKCTKIFLSAIAVAVTFMFWL